MNRRIRDESRRAVLARSRLDHFDAATLQFLDERASGAAFGRRQAELIVHDECAQGQPLRASRDHRSLLRDVVDAAQGGRVTH
jgi:hypothetical protein